MLDQQLCYKNTYENEIPIGCKESNDGSVKHDIVSEDLYRNTQEGVSLERISRAGICHPEEF